MSPIAIILAGGKGTRLGELTRDIPKPMVRIGERPLLEHQIRLLARYGITDVILITGHLSQAIEDYFGHGEELGVQIQYFVEDEPLGTTGGIKHLQNYLTKDFIVLYGDIMIDMDLARLIEFHKSNSSNATLVLHPNDHPYDSDLLETDNDDRIVAWHAKPHTDDTYYRNLVNAGVYVLSPRIIEDIPHDSKADFGHDIFPWIVNRRRMFGYNSTEYIKDVGTPQRLEEVTNDYLTGRVQQFNRQNQRPAVFLDRDGVINKYVPLLNDPQQFELIEGSVQAIRKLNASDYLTVVVTNQPVIARNLCTIEQLDYIHKKMDTLLGGQRAKIDAVYYCPHHPDKGYPEENPKYKTKCRCRKPGIAMIEQANRDFNIDLSHSFIVGDSVRDILCGQGAGLTTIGVRTGQGCRDGDSKPDFMADDLNDAVSLILSQSCIEHDATLLTSGTTQ